MNSIVRLLVPFLDIAFSFVSGIRKQAQPVELAVSVKDWQDNFSLVSTNRLINDEVGELHTIIFLEMYLPKK